MAFTSKGEGPDVVEGAARRRVPAAAQEDAPVRERVERRGDARRRAGDVKLLPRALGAVHRQEPGLGRRLEAAGAGRVRALARAAEEDHAAGVECGAAGRAARRRAVRGVELRPLVGLRIKNIRPVGELAVFRRAAHDQQARVAHRRHGAHRQALRALARGLVGLGDATRVAPYHPVPERVDVDAALGAAADRRGGVPRHGAARQGVVLLPLELVHVERVDRITKRPARALLARVPAPADHKFLLAARAHERLRGRRGVHGLRGLEARRLDRRPRAVLEGVEAIDGVARLVQAAPQQDAAVLQRGAGRAGNLRAFAGGLPRQGARAADAARA
mmetsp:Transcript_8640/g.23416  ORF Transcript_8640/g.23416 Transcript_8640/m.23416 type:complete len:332 (+) Transcript_8640:18-1013(+)